jgi:hypothetical protein
MTVTIGGTTVSPSNVTGNSFSLVTPPKVSGYEQVVVTTVQGASPLTAGSGYVYSGLGSYQPVNPFRILDTRVSGGPLGPGGIRVVQITDVMGLPSGPDPIPINATAVVLNVTAVGSSQASLLTVYPNGTARPTASNLNFAANRTLANLVTVALGQNGSGDNEREVAIFNAVGKVNVVVDVEGYFFADAAGIPNGEFHAMAPLRVCDTRAGMSVNLCNQGRENDNLLGPGQVMKVNVSGVPSGVAGAPASIPGNGEAIAAVLNLTGVQGSAATFLSVFPTQSDGSCATGAPQFSNINVLAGVNQANRVMVRLGPASAGGPSRDVCVYNAAGKVNFVLDANGWFGSSTAPLGAQFQAVGPTRICDTRLPAGSDCGAETLTNRGTLQVDVAGVQGMAGSGIVGIIANLTAVNGNQPTYLMGYPGGSRPATSDINVVPGETLANLMVVGLGGGDMDLFNSAGRINAVIDVDGWFS